MRVSSFLAIMPLALTLSGCAELAYQIAKPDTGILPPTAGPITEIGQSLRDLPPPNKPVAVAVYNYADQTGQFKAAPTTATVQTLSRAVTQGSTSILIKALQDAGSGRWFTVIERERLDNLLKERRIIADMRQRYLGEETVNPSALPPLLFAGVLIDGGIIGFDSNTKTGGIGANYFGIGGNVTYSEDTVTVYLRGTSVRTGQVLLSVVANKKILSYGIDGNVYRYVTFNRLLQAEAGVTHNEPGSLAVEQAIQQAVMTFIVEGAARGLWAFKDPAFQSQIIDQYELKYLAAAQAQVKSDEQGATAVASNRDAAKSKSANATTPAKAQVRASAQAVSEPKPVKWAAWTAPANGGPQQPNAGEAPKLLIKRTTLEDEAPISPR